MVELRLARGCSAWTVALFHSLGLPACWSFHPPCAAVRSANSRLLKEYKEIIKNRSTPSTDKQEIALFPPVSQRRDQLICCGH